MRVIHLMEQHIAPIASLDHFIRRRSITRNHNFSIPSLKRVAISLFPYPMLNRKRGHRNVRVAINHPSPNLMHLDLVSSCVSLLQSPLSNPHIFRPSLLEVRSHALQPTRTISLQPLRPPQHPGEKIRSGYPSVWSECR